MGRERGTQGHGHGARDSLQEPAADQELRIPGGARQERGEREDDHADIEDASAAMDVADTPHGDHEHGQHQEEGVHHPLQLVDGGMQVALDAGQDGVDDGEVDEDDEAQDADADKGEPSI